MYKNEKNCVLFRFLGRRLGTRLNKLMLNQNRLLISLIVGNNYWMHATRVVEEISGPDEYLFVPSQNMTGGHWRVR